MSDEYSVHTNFQRASDDPRARGEYEHRMQRVRDQREAQDELLALMEEEARETQRASAIKRASEALAELTARRRRREMRAIDGGGDG